MDMLTTTSTFYFLLSSSSENYDIFGNANMATNPSTVNISKIRMASTAGYQIAKSGYIDSSGSFFFSIG